ncbi:MAG: hypothetical protein K0Q89_57 [Thermomicrobiales bacterium]|jgi:hypothetical protein|nr:hypothetical protein [Thermomicrobiales bacterium]
MQERDDLLPRFAGTYHVTDDPELWWDDPDVYWLAAGPLLLERPA